MSKGGGVAGEEAVRGEAFWVVLRASVARKVESVVARRGGGGALNGGRERRDLGATSSGTE